MRKALKYLHKKGQDKVVVDAVDLKSHLCTRNICSREINIFFLSERNNSILITHAPFKQCHQLWMYSITQTNC